VVAKESQAAQGFNLCLPIGAIKSIQDKLPIAAKAAGTKED
jgi:hypothetical protein